jgi:hypothetical protein
VNRKPSTVILKLFEYCRSNNWAGYDPYDALNSEIFKKLPFLDSKWPRIILTQLLKRSPINFRPLLMVPKTQNPKALALFLMAFLMLEKAGLLKDKDLIPLKVQQLADLRSCTIPSTGNRQPETENREPSTDNYWCWGYSFPWQGRSVLAPKGDPNLVCTVFVANALLDHYEAKLAGGDPPATGNCQPLNDNNLLFMASSAAEYLLNELYWEDENGNAGFSYPLPSLKARVHNANFLGAALLCRVYKHNGATKYLEPALRAARYSSGMQHTDGSWAYGEHITQQWVDNFHTGYNLGALRTISECLKTDEFQPYIQQGFKFYRDHFFREDGAPKYFHNKTYPIDIHSVAQSIITLVEFRDLDPDNIRLAHKVLEWVMANMWNEKGYFYYQVTPYYKNRISYMRWSQAWMLYALSILNEHLDL